MGTRSVRQIGVILVFGLLLSMFTVYSDWNLSAEAGSRATSGDIIKTVDSDKMMDTINELTSAKYKGRLAGSEENSQAADFIAEYFKKIGLENPRGLNNYQSLYVQPLLTLKSEPVMQLVDKKGKVTSKFAYPENFVLRRLSSETNQLDITAPLYLVDDIDAIYKENPKLKGKILLIPWKFYPFFASQNHPVDFAKITGALGAIGEFDLKRNELGYKYLKVRPLGREWNPKDTNKPFAFVDSNTFATLRKAARAGERLHFKCDSESYNLGMAANCIGLVRGTDPKLKDNYIIIGAHFDHVGDNLDGTWNPGALDNASGMAVMMELARVVKQSPVQPRKSILFLAFNGEESGINGSRSYCQGPSYPLNKAVMINLDMVGSASKVPLMLAVANKKSDTSLRNAVGACADKMSVKYVYGVDEGSDHASFDAHGVPSLCLINMDLSLGYHSTHDTVKMIDEKRLEEVARLVAYYIGHNAY